MRRRLGLGGVLLLAVACTQSPGPAATPADGGEPSAAAPPAETAIAGEEGDLPLKQYQPPREDPPLAPGERPPPVEVTDALCAKYVEYTKRSRKYEDVAFREFRARMDRVAVMGRTEGMLKVSEYAQDWGIHRKILDERARQEVGLTWAEIKHIDTMVTILRTYLDFKTAKPEEVQRLLDGYREQSKYWDPKIENREAVVNEQLSNLDNKLELYRGDKLARSRFGDAAVNKVLAILPLLEPEKTPRPPVPTRQ